MTEEEQTCRLAMDVLVFACSTESVKCNIKGSSWPYMKLVSNAFNLEDIDALIQSDGDMFYWLRLCLLLVSLCSSLLFLSIGIHKHITSRQF